MSMMERRKLIRRVEFDGNLERDLLCNKLQGVTFSTMAEFQVTSATEGRLDLISRRFFNTFHLGWLIAHHNDILDPFNEVSRGRVLKIPDLQEYFSFYNDNAR